MDTSMHLDVRPTLSGNRKRSVQDLNGGDNEEAPLVTTQDDTPQKRLRNRKGDAVHRQVLKYNAHALLNHLAFTRIYMTANFQTFNLASSPVIICILSNHAQLYHALCQALPPLYSVAPTLQAFAILTGLGPLQIYAVAMPSLLRMLPIAELADLDEEAAADFEAFRLALPESEDTIVVVDASGNCIWTSAELVVDDGAHHNDAVSLCSAMAHALGVRPKTHSNDDVGEMDEG